MKLMTARVVHDHIDLPPGTVRDGATVTLLVPDDKSDPVELTAGQRAFLIESASQADRGETVDGWKLLEELRPE